MQFDNFVEKKIFHLIEVLINEGFRHKNLIGVNLFSSIKTKFFYGMSYNLISIITDNNENIINITIHFNSIINRNFYNQFIVDYGLPNSIIVLDNFKFLNDLKKVNEKKIFNSSKVILDTKEGNFDDNPLFIIWKNANVNIKTLTKFEKDLTELTFKKTDCK